MNKKRVLVPLPMLIIRPIVGIGEKTPFFPINLEQLSLFDSDNILKNKEKGFDYLKILPRKVISEVKKRLNWLNKYRSLDFEIDNYLVDCSDYVKHGTLSTDKVIYKK